MRPVADDDFPRGPDGRSTDVASGGGVPAWIAASLNYCTRCGSPLQLGPIEGEDRDRLACARCGHIAYVNPRLVAVAINGDVVPKTQYASARVRAGDTLEIVRMVGGG